MCSKDVYQEGSKIVLYGCVLPLEVYTGCTTGRLSSVSFCKVIFFVIPSRVCVCVCGCVYSAGFECIYSEVYTCVCIFRDYVCVVVVWCVCLVLCHCR
jgi:hypothetical protein